MNDAPNTPHTPASQEDVTPDPERQAEAKEYARVRRRLMLVDLVSSSVLLFLFLITGASQAYKTWLVDLGLTSPWVLVPAYIGSLIVGVTVLFWPLAWYRGYVLPHRYDMSTQTPKGWWTDELKMLGLGLALGLPVAELLYWFLRSYPETWWLWASGASVLLSLLLGYLLPVVFVPIFYKLEPLDDPELVERIERLAQKTGTQVAGVYTIDLSSRTKAANAMVMGMGKTKRIALGDTLYDDFTPLEIETILAHELGHQVRHDLELGVIVQSVLQVASLYLAKLFLDWGVAYFDFTGPGDVAALPLLLMATALFSLISMPLVNAYSRWRERRADRYALQVTEAPTAFRHAMKRLANQNLAEMDPPSWVVVLLYDHPPIRTRLRIAREYAGSS